MVTIEINKKCLDKCGSILMWLLCPMKIKRVCIQQVYFGSILLNDLNLSGEKRGFKEWHYFYRIVWLFMHAALKIYFGQNTKISPVLNFLTSWMPREHSVYEQSGITAYPIGHNPSVNAVYSLPSNASSIFKWRYRPISEIVTHHNEHNSATVSYEDHTFH